MTKPGESKHRTVDPDKEEKWFKRKKRKARKKDKLVRKTKQKQRRKK